jgi:hypothetical protein
MAAKTEQFKSAGSMLGKTIGQSISMIRGVDVANYSLLFMDPTADYKRGEHQTIFMPHIVIGRSSKCHIKYTDDYRTVSREHASITIDGNRYILHHNPAAANPTYVNGSVVGGAYALQNGDEVQFSSNGPRMRFNVSTMKTSTIGLTNRIGAAMAQAAKPYKRAITLLSAIIILLFFGLGYSYYHQLEQDRRNREIADGMSTKIDSLLGAVTKQDSFISKLPRKFKNIEAPVNKGTSNPVPDALSLPDEDVYFIQSKQVFIEYENSVYKSEYQWVGTGFLTEDGYFITARHVITPWRFPQHMETYKLSVLEANGAKINVAFTATSKNGRVLNFNSSDLTFDDTSDELIEYEYEEDGKTETVYSKERTDISTDWAYYKPGNLSGKCKLNREIATKLKMGQKLYTLGFSYGEAAQSSNGSELKPLYSESNVAQNGVTNGLINTTNRGFGTGNSGGPVFIHNGQGFEVIGIVSHGRGSESGIIVPISNIF